MAADLGLVPHTAQRCAHELAPQGAGDAAAGGGLTHAGRANEAEDRPLLVGLEPPHGQVLQDAFFDLLQAVVVLVEDRPRPGQVEVVLGGLVPGQIDEPLQVGPGHRVLWGLGGDLLQPRHLLARDLLHVGGHVARDDALLELGAVVVLFGVAELLLNRAHTLTQHCLTLVAAHLCADVGLDVFLDLVGLQGAVEPQEHLTQPLGDVQQVEQFHLLRQGALDVGGGHVGQQSRLTHLIQQRGGLVWHVGGDADQLLGSLPQRHGQPLGLDLLLARLLNHLEVAPHHAIDLFELEQADAVQTPRDEGGARRGDGHHPQRLGLDPHGEDVGQPGVLDLCQGLGDEGHAHVLLFSGQLCHGQGLGPAHINGQDHPWKEDHVAQRDNRQAQSIFRIR